MASELGAQTLIVSRDTSKNEFMENVKTCLGGLSDITIDCTGIETTITQGIEVTLHGTVLGTRVFKSPL